MSKSPQISWYILDEEDYLQHDEYYLGSFSPDSEIALSVQVWNNRYGQVDVTDIQDAKLVIYFESTEDSVLLQYCSVSVNNSALSKVETMFSKAVIDIGLLSGSLNNGVANIDNVDNYKNISIVFKGFPASLKNGIKNMYLDIELE